MLILRDKCHVQCSFMVPHAAQGKKAHQHVGGRMPCPQLVCAAAALPEASKATGTLLKLLNAEHGICYTWRSSQTSEACPGCQPRYGKEVHRNMLQNSWGQALIEASCQLVTGILCGNDDTTHKIRQLVI